MAEKNCITTISRQYIFNTRDRHRCKFPRVWNWLSILDERPMYMQMKFPGRNQGSQCWAWQGVIINLLFHREFCFTCTKIFTVVKYVVFQIRRISCWFKCGFREYYPLSCFICDTSFLRMKTFSFLMIFDKWWSKWFKIR